MMSAIGSVTSLRSRAAFAKCHEVESSEVREHPVEIGALQLEEPWTWGIAGELKSGWRCFLTAMGLGI